MRKKRGIPDIISQKNAVFCAEGLFDREPAPMCAPVGNCDGAVILCTDARKSGWLDLLPDGMRLWG